MSEPSDLQWKREGDSIKISYSYVQHVSSGIVFLYMKDPRTRWQKLKDWYAVKFKNEIRPIYIDPSKAKMAWE